MKAIVWASRGLPLQAVPRPTPKSHGDLIRIKAELVQVVWRAPCAEVALCQQRIPDKEGKCNGTSH